MHTITECVKASTALQQKCSVAWKYVKLHSHSSFGSKFIEKSFKSNSVSCPSSSYSNPNKFNCVLKWYLLGKAIGKFPFGSNPKYVCSSTYNQKGVSLIRGIDHRSRNIGTWHTQVGNKAKGGEFRHITFLCFPLGVLVKHRFNWNFLKLSNRMHFLS